MKLPPAIIAVVCSSIIPILALVWFSLRPDSGREREELLEGRCRENQERIETLEKDRDTLADDVERLREQFESLAVQLRNATDAERTPRRASPSGQGSDDTVAEDTTTDGALAISTAGNDETREPGSGLTESQAEQLDAALEILTDPTIRGRKRQETWSALAKAGLLDRAIEDFELRAEELPDDAQAQADLGDAYIQKIFTVSEIEKGKWSRKADGAYDQALALDETHWEARFSKAVNYSFVPPIFGLQPKAIEQFEILRSQQEARDPEPRFSETYLLLGNLHANQGNPDKAREVWAQGRERFPENKQLEAKLAGLKDE